MTKINLFYYSYDLPRTNVAKNVSYIYFFRKKQIPFLKKHLNTTKTKVIPLKKNLKWHELYLWILAGLR